MNLIPILKSGKVFFRMRGLLIFSFVLLCGVLGSCKKFLDKPTQKTLVIPETLEDCQAMMEGLVSLTVDMPELLSDNYFLSTSSWQFMLSYTASNPGTAAAVHHQAFSYVWQDDLTYDGSWVGPWRPIYYCNAVLDILPGIAVDDSNKDEWNRIKGQALFKRAHGFWHLAQTYCKPYSSSASSDLGLPIRLTIDFEERSVRSSLEETYDQIINDLKIASAILPESTLNPTRPNKAAAFGALSRVYLSMRDYENAGRYADSCLARNNSLMDYNTLNPSAPVPIPLFNEEVIFYDEVAGIGALTGTGNILTMIDTLLYQSYDSNDLRKAIFFRQVGSGRYGFQGNYTRYGPTKLFGGIATDEVYLNRAECYARAGNMAAALNDLNTLLQSRWRNTVTYIPITATDAEDALDKILVERRKELLFRNLRWSDLRRLNLEGANITLTRIVGGSTYTLPPNDVRWVRLIPQSVINYSGMQQNPR